MRTTGEIDSEIRLLEDRLAGLRRERASAVQAPSHYLCGDCGSKTVLHGAPGKQHTCWQCGSYRLHRIDL